MKATDYWHVTCHRGLLHLAILRLRRKLAGAQHTIASLHAALDKLRERRCGSCRYWDRYGEDGYGRCGMLHSTPHESWMCGCHFEVAA